MLCGPSLRIDAAEAAKRAAERGLQTRYWTPDVHVAAFALPAFVRRIVETGTEPFAP
jgi:spermidine synthase